jgi:hypothetical protein
MRSELLRQFEEALRKRNPVLHERLKRGLSEARIRTKLEKAGVTGNVEPIVSLYSWKNGTDLDSSLTQSQASPFPESIYIFMDFSMMLGHFEGFRHRAKDFPSYGDIQERFFPLFWDGSDGWIAVDLQPAKQTRVVVLVMELEDAVMQAYETFDAFLTDAIRANNEDDELTCFSAGLRPDRTERSCTFCRESLSNVGNLIESEHGAAICNRCVSLCYDAMQREGADLTLPSEPVVRLDWIKSR